MYDAYLRMEELLNKIKQVIVVKVVMYENV
jgi:hypothetical protein